MERFAALLNGSQNLVAIAGQNVLLATEVIENDIPLLLSKDTMKKANTYIDFSNDKTIILKYH